jgi:hypothetical protein
MFGAMWRLSKGYRLCPWRSPYLRWRIETYCGLHANGISPRAFWKFTWQNRRELMRFLRWADKMDGMSHDD